jgi:hypothetical protein
LLEVEPLDLGLITQLFPEPNSCYQKERNYTIIGDAMQDCSSSHMLAHHEDGILLLLIVWAQ